MKNVNLSKPIEIAPDTFWIGHYLPNISLQCHTYLIRKGNESAIIDPGGIATFPYVLQKMTQLIKLGDVKYLILSHQDPDIVGCVPMLENVLPPRENRLIVTHWRTFTLLRYLSLKTHFYLIDNNGWKLKLPDRTLEFVFTPYAHFAGSFCTYDPKTNIMFSSDIFGSMSDKFSLFAKDEEWYYKGVELFHKHYMPSKTILRYALNKIEDKKPKMIAPQHGSIIKGNMIHKVTERLKKINCGLYLIAGEGNDNLNSLEEVDDILSRFFEITVLTSNLAPVLKELYKLIKRKIATLNQIRLTGNISDEKLLVIDVNDNGASRNIVSKSLNANSAGSICKSIGLTFGRQNLGYLMICGKLTKMQEETIQTLLRALRRPIKAILRREISEIRKTLMMQKEIYTDPLTQLYNRRFLEDKVPAFLEDYYKAELPISVVMIDIDFFKRVNDTYGHDAGDCVLRDIGKLLRENLRSSDFAIRYGGEEFLIVLPNTKGKETCKKLDKLHNYIAGKKFCKDKINITISAGVNECNPSSNLISCIKKADEKLYKAKNNGRNMVIC